MDYRAAFNRCAVIIDDLRLPVSHEEVLEILHQKGFNKLEVDLIKLARNCLVDSKYRRGSRLVEAPEFFDCSSFIKWLYGQRGIWLPRRSIQQRFLGEVISLNQEIAGDVIFISGAINYYDINSSDGVGHAGIYTGEGTVVHAANRNLNLVETPLSDFITKSNFRGIRRYLPVNQEVITFELPLGREVETEDDIRWIILQSLNF
ncbi:MAG: NlpC/P60 family protein [Patescibacteria group bacterium]